MKIPTPTLLRAAFLAAACGSLASSALATDGYFVQGFGAVNSSLGGAATAGNDQDLIGSIYKNPATGRRAVIPFPGSRDLNVNVLRSILRQADLAEDEFVKLL